LGFEKTVSKKRGDELKSLFYRFLESGGRKRPESIEEGRKSANILAPVCKMPERVGHNRVNEIGCLSGWFLKETGRFI